MNKATKKLNLICYCFFLYFLIFLLISIFTTALLSTVEKMMAWFHPYSFQKAKKLQSIFSKMTKLNVPLQR